MKQYGEMDVELHSFLILALYTSGQLQALDTVYGVDWRSRRNMLAWDQGVPTLVSVSVPEIRAYLNLWVFQLLRSELTYTCECFSSWDQNLHTLVSVPAPEIRAYPHLWVFQLLRSELTHTCECSSSWDQNLHTLVSVSVPEIRAYLHLWVFQLLRSELTYHISVTRCTKPNRSLCLYVTHNHQRFIALSGSLPAGLLRSACRYLVTVVSEQTFGKIFEGLSSPTTPFNYLTLK